MRDPDRIDDFCKELSQLWHKVPDWRFGQMMVNVMSGYMGDTGRDPFFPEDDELLEYMKQYFKKVFSVEE